MISRKEKIYSSLLICFICCLIYSNIHNHGYVLDDDLSITHNTFVHKGFAGLKDIFTSRLWDGYNVETNIKAYRPITIASFAIEYQFFKLNPKASHTINIGIYALLCVFIYITFLTLFKNKYPFLPLLIALIFAIHPIHTEVVCNLKSRDELLSLTFAVIAMYNWIQFIETKRLWQYILAVFLYLLSLLSKETSVCFLAIMPFTAYYFLNVKWKKISIQMLPFILVFLCFLVVRAWVFSKYGDKFVAITHLQNPLLLATNFSEANGTKLYLLGKYLQLLFIPYNLTFSYFYNDIPIIKLFHWQAIISLSAYLMIAYFIWRNFSKQNIAVYGALFYLLGIFLFSHIAIPFGNAMGERLVFTASLGYCISISYLFYSFLNVPSLPTFKSFFKLNFTQSKSAIALSILIICFFAYSIKTYSRNLAWKDKLTLYKTDVITSPNSHIANRHLARTYYVELKQNPARKQEVLPLALHHFQKITEIAPDDIAMWEMYGWVLLENNDMKKAELCFKEAITRYNHQKNIGFTGSVNYIEQQNLDWERIYQTSLCPIYPHISYLHRQIGINYLLTKHYNEALTYLQSAYKEFNTVKEKEMINNDLGILYLNGQKPQEALSFFLQAYQINPNSSLINGNIGICYAQLDKLPESAVYFTQAYQQDRANIQIVNYLVQVYKKLGDSAKYQYYLQIYQQLNK